MERIKGSSVVIHTDIFGQTPADENDTSCLIGNEPPFGAAVGFEGYNRKVRRYAEKHGVSLNKAFDAIYGGKGR